MRTTTHAIFGLWLLLCPFLAWSQTGDVQQLEALKESARLYMDVSSYDNAISEYQRAIDKAQELGLPQEAIELQRQPDLMV